MVMGGATSSLSDGRVHLALDNLVLNISSQATYENPSTVVAPSIPKKRRFNPFGSIPVASPPFSASPQIASRYRYFFICVSFPLIL